MNGFRTIWKHSKILIFRRFRISFVAKNASSVKNCEHAKLFMVGFTHCRWNPKTRYYHYHFIETITIVSVNSYENLIAWSSSLLDKTRVINMNKCCHQQLAVETIHKATMARNSITKVLWNEDHKCLQLHCIETAGWFFYIVNRRRLMQVTKINTIDMRWKYAMWLCSECTPSNKMDAGLCGSAISCAVISLIRFISMSDRGRMQANNFQIWYETCSWTVNHRMYGVNIQGVMWW
jgi:hypothetical protein